ncbi:hypothetical protein K457DRAFT_81873, partial [Linnemannia elongata AG-77]
FENISRPCRHISDLSDGIILFEVAADIDPKWFKLIRSADMGDNWVHKYNNLKKLHKLVTRYLEEKQGQSLSKLDPPNLNMIAKDGDSLEVLKLCELVIAVAVQCDRNQHYIQRIQTLPEISQHALMISLEQVKITRKEETIVSSHILYREEISVDQELAQLHQSRDELERGNQSLMQELANMNRKYDELLTEKEELKQRIRDLEKASAHASQSGKSDFLMRTEIDHLRQDLRKSEDRRQEQEILINNQLKAISDLSRALEEGADLRRQMKVLEDQNTELLDRNKEVEGEYRKVLAFKSLMESYKEQIQTLEDKNSSLAKEKNKIEYEARLQNQQFQQIEADRTRDSEQIQLLEDKIRELEFSGVHQGTPLSSDLQDMETDDMESSMMNRTAQTTELKLTISRLEREIQSLREETQDEGGSKATVLQHLLDDANKSKAKFEQDYLEEHQAKIILQSELDRIRGGKGDESEVAFTLRSTLNSCEKELSETKKTLAEMETNLEQTKKELVIEFLALQEEHAKLIEKTQSLEAENKHYLSQLNQVLTEKDGLSKLELEQRDRMLQQERAQSGEAQEAHTREQLETKNRHLEQQLEQMTQQMNQYSMKLNRAKEFIVQQDAMIKDGKTKQPAEGYSEAVESLQTELATKEEEVESLKRQMREMEIQVRREQQLMTSAWHDQLRKGIRDNVISQHQRIAPTSWLGVQRRVFSAQLGVRH